MIWAPAEPAAALAQDENGKPVGLKLTKLGYAAIGADHKEAKEAASAPVVAQIDSVRAGTKQAAVIDLLARAVLSGLRKKGFDLMSEKLDGGERRYSVRVLAQASAA